MNFTNGPWRQLTDRTWVARCEPAGVNIGLVAGEKHALLIDAGSHPDQGRALAASAAELIGRKVDHLVVTHWHWDHWFGARGVAADTFIAHEELANWRTHEDLLADAAEHGVAPGDILAPTHPMALAKALDLGGVRVEILHFGTAHTNSDLVVIVPGENVIFMGDLIEEGADPQFGADTKVGTWPAALEGPLAVSDDDTKFVPGHGEVVDQDFVFRQRAEISMLTFEGERFARTGVSLDEAVTAVEWPFVEATLSAALPLVYAELKAKGVKRQLPLV